MSFFNFFSSKKTNFTENMRQAPAFSRSIYMKSVDAYLMMVMYDKDLIYFNDKDPNLYQYDQRDGTRDFPGKIYKLMLKQKDGHTLYLFYGTLDDLPIDYDTATIQIIKDLLSTVPGLIDVNNIAKAPTAYTYTCWSKNGKYMITNFSGTDTFVIDGVNVRTGDREDLLRFMD